MSLIIPTVQTTRGFALPEAAAEPDAPPASVREQAGTNIARKKSATDANRAARSAAAHK
jgi:hypothetical protein